MPFLGIGAFVVFYWAQVLTFGVFIGKIAPLFSEAPTNTPFDPMWPVQTLTLLLCLTDDEQLYALHSVVDPAMPAIELVIPATEDPETLNEGEEGPVDC